MNAKQKSLLLSAEILSVNYLRLCALGKELIRKNSWQLDDYLEGIYLYLVKKHNYKLEYTRSLSVDHLKALLSQELKDLPEDIEFSQLIHCVRFLKD